MSTQSDPAVGAVSITPNDSTDLTVTTRGIFVGGAGNISLVSADGNTVTFASCAAGSILPIVTKRVMATDTTATALVALY